MVFTEMLESAVAESQIDLLKFRYTTEVTKRAIMSPHTLIPKSIRVGLQKVYIKTRQKCEKQYTNLYIVWLCRS